jgi:Tol biopolymer transport system component/DNA-binding winged helix-turn-helix (wHTH) protein
MALYTFGPFLLNEEARVLLRANTPVPLTGKVFDTLTVLVKNRGRVMEKEQLLSAVWPDAVVEEANLAQNVSTLRKALGESAKEYRFIATIAGRGYSFVAPVLELPEAATQTPEPCPRPRPKRGKLLAATVLIALIAGVTGWVFVAKPGRRANLPEQHIVPFTTYPGLEIMPAFSPDGQQIAYVRGEEGTAYVNLWKPLHGRSSIYTKLIGAGTEIRVTKGFGTDSYPVWSPDGQYIAFARRAPGASGYYVVSALGGAERRITGATEDPCAGLAWTPDGKGLVVSEMSERSRSSPLVAVSIETGGRRVLTSPPEGSMADVYPVFSPDGQWLAFIREGDSGSDVHVLPANGGQLRRLTFDKDWKEQVAWMPGSREILFSTGVFTDRLWRIPLRGGAPVAITSGDQSTCMPTVARNGERLAYALVANSINLWRIDLTSLGLGVAGTPKKLIASTRMQKDPQYSRDGTKIAFLSDRSGTPQLWVSDAEGRNPTQLTHMEGDPGSPNWSPDGSEIAFDSSPNENADIWVIRSDGGAPRRITTHAADDFVPSWSKDGRWIYFASARGGEFQIWKVPRAGESPSGPAVQVTTGGGFRAFESFDGGYLYFSKGRGKPGLWRRALGTSPNRSEEPVLPSLQSWGWWTLAPNGIYFLEEQGGIISLKHFDPSRRATVLVTQLPALVIDASPAMTARFDGRSIVYVQIDSGNSDIMLVENFR